MVRSTGIATAATKSFANSAAITSGGGNIVVLAADLMNLQDGTISTGGAAAAPWWSSSRPTTTGASQSVDARRDGRGQFARAPAKRSELGDRRGLLEIGYRNENGTAAVSGNINIATAVTFSTAKSVRTWR